MALTKIGATLGGSADVITVTQNSHGLILGRPVKMTSSGYAHATADTAANAEAIGIVIASDWDGSSGANTTFTLALSGRITVDGCVPNLAAGTVLFLQVASGLLAAAEPSGANQVSKPMAVVTVANSEMIMVQQRGEVVSTGGATIADNSVTNAKVATGIDAVKLADGTVTNAELQFINSLSSNAQTQLSAKASASGLTVVENDIKQLIVTTGFLSLRVAALASLSKYNLGDLFIDDFADSTGLDTSFTSYSATREGGYIKGGLTHDSNTIIFISGDGTNGTTVSNSNINSGGTYDGAWSVNSDPVFTNAQRKFTSYATSILFDKGTNASTADYIESAANNAALNAGMDTSSNKEFTMEAFIYLTGQPGGRALLSCNGDTGSWANVGRSLMYATDAARRFQYALGGGPNEENIPSGGAPSSEVSANAWHHICLGRHQHSSGSTSYRTRIYVDGINRGWGSETSSAISYTTAMKFRINGFVYPNTPSGGDPASADVYMQDLRYSNTWRYNDAGATRGSNADFTVPTTSLASGGGGGTSVSQMFAVSNATTATSVPTKGDLLLTYEDSAGTATLNTDIKAYISRNNGTTFTEGVLVQEGTIGTQKVVAFHDFDNSDQSSAPAMRYKITTHNQSASKETRVHGVVMGWS